jgi:Uma2 family endonuclease
MQRMTKAYTRAEYELLPEGFPAQLIEGQLVQEPAPTFGHQRLAFAIGEKLKCVVGPRRMGIAPIDIAIDEFNVFQPDLVVFRRTVRDEESGLEAGVPLLVVEVLSPSTHIRDREVKRTRLLESGVDEVWLVDATNRTVELYDGDRYRDVPRRVTGASPMISVGLPGFELTPSELFR